MTEPAPNPIRDDSGGWQQATIEHIEPQTPTVRTFIMRPHAPVPFLPGQHIDVRLIAPDGYEARRSYSLSSSPRDPDVFELAIEALDGGEVSSWFHAVAQTGDVIEVRGPFTTYFVWRPEEDGAVLLVGGGSGVAPLMSMVRHRAGLSSAPPMTLVYSARSWADVIFRTELLEHELRQPGLQLLLIITRDSAGAPAGRTPDYTRRLDAEIVRSIVSRLPERPHTCFVCGNNSFVGTVADALVEAGVPARAVRTERYGG